MKSIQLLCFLLMITFYSCSNDVRKFVGKWKPVNTSDLASDVPSDVFMTIDKQDKQYFLINSLYPKQPVLFTYPKKEDMMTGGMQNMVINIKYIDSINHLSFSVPASGHTSIELKKVE